MLQFSCTVTFVLFLWLETSSAAQDATETAAPVAAEAAAEPATEAPSTEPAGDVASAAVVPDKPPEPAPPPPPPKPSSVLPFKVHCGEIVAAIATEEAVDYVDMDRVLLARKFVPKPKGDEDSAVPRPPPDGKAYGIVTVNVKPGRTLGKEDYKMSCKGVPVPCRALSVLGQPFDERHLEITASRSALEVRMLYEIPRQLAGATLRFALPVAIPQPSIPLVFVTGSAKQAPATGGEATAEPVGNTNGSDEPVAAEAPAVAETPAQDGAQMDAGTAATPEEAPAKVPAEAPAAKPATKPVADPAKAKPAPQQDGMSDWF